MILLSSFSGYLISVLCLITTNESTMDVPVPSQGFVHHTWPIDRLGSDEDEGNSQYKQDDLLHTV